jgi:uncharacterized protein (UPF0333 family)
MTDYVETANGWIHKDDIPLILPESPTQQLKKLLITFSLIALVIIVCMIVVYAAQSNYENWYTVKMSDYSASHNKLSTVSTSAPARKIVISNNYAEIPLERVVIVCHNYELVVPIMGNNSVKRTPILPAGQSYSIDFASEHRIKELMLVAPEGKTVGTVNIQMYTSSDRMSWSYSGILDSRENSVPVTAKTYLR